MCNINVFRFSRGTLSGNPFKYIWWFTSHPEGLKTSSTGSSSDLLVDSQLFVSVTAHLTHFISQNCFLISWRQQHCHSVFGLRCVLKCLMLSFYFIIHFSWKGRFPLEEQECRFGESRDPSWVLAFLFTGRVTLENPPTLSGPGFMYQ